MKKTILAIFLLAIILVSPALLFAEDNWAKLSGAVDYVSSTVGIGAVSSRLSSIYTNHIAAPLTSNTQIRTLYNAAGSIPGIGKTLQSGMFGSYKIATNPGGSFNSISSPYTTGISKISSDLSTSAVSTISYSDYMLKNIGNSVGSAVGSAIKYSPPYQSGGEVVNRITRPGRIGNNSGY